MHTNQSYIVASKRSPIGHFLGSLARVRATDIGGQVAKALIDELKIDKAVIDEVYIGHVLQGGCGQNPARQVALAAGIPDKISATTVNKVCGSSLQAAMFADQVIRSGDAQLVLTGGIESMSLAPHFVRNLRTGQKFGNTELVDLMAWDGLTNVYDNEIMGIIADETGTKAGITRLAQDEFSVRSHQLAAKADRAGFFASHRVPITVPKSDIPFNTDETIRLDASVEKMAALKPAFKKDGTITAANASSISDGAAMNLIAGEAAVRKYNLKPLARIVAHATSGGPPRDLFLAPIGAIRMVCEKAGWELRQVDIIELNEAFAAQVLACVKGLELAIEKINPHGGAVALGHPIGASGARVLGTLVHGLKWTNSKRGIASLCLGGGNAVAMAVEAV